jgi:hypothetical protein
MTLTSDADRPRRLPIPRSRRIVIDIMRLSERVPTVAHDRICDLRAVSSAREAAAQRVSWGVLFVKAFAIVAEKYPRLRQVYLTWPWPHLYQHPQSVAMIVTHREVEGEPWIFWSRLPRPERRPLTDLQAKLDEFQSRPVQQVFQKQWWFSGFPGWLRRMIWWWTLNVSVASRIRRCGTFFLTTIGSRGAEIQHPPGFLTANLTFGPIDERGRSRVTLAYDHRIMDGRMVADILADLERTLNGQLVQELNSIRTAEGALRSAA